MYEEGTLEWFKIAFWPINPVTAGPGSTVETAYYFASRAIGDRLPDDTFLTWIELVKRYTDFYNYMLPRQNDKYTKKEDKLVCIEDYCNDKLYLSDYSIMQGDPADSYLFGI